MLHSSTKRLLAVALIAACSAGMAAEPMVETIFETTVETIVLRGAGQFDHGIVPARARVDMHRLPRLRKWRPGQPIKEIPQRKGIPKHYAPLPRARQPAGGDALRAYGSRFPVRKGGRSFNTPSVNGDGIGFTGVNPPDTVGDVGNRHFVQMVNGGGAVDGTQVRVLDKADGTEVARFALGDLAVGTQTGCTEGAGDPIIMFDAAVDNGPGDPAGRWFLSEFTDVSLCVYISETADVMAGSWFIYEFVSDSGGLPDYPKYGVWSDAYYVGANENGATLAGEGRNVYALDRESMLAGLPTRPTQVFEVPLLGGFGFQMLHPADWDGKLAPPVGMPGLFLRHRDDEVHDGLDADPTQDFLEIWTFSVDWDDPGNSTLTGPFDIGVADFESELCGLTAFACVPQPGSDIRLDPLREPVMWRAQYRNFGTYQAVVANWVTDVVGGAADVHGVRWTELRNIGSGWSLHQQGTVSPDDVNRWMGSIAMDGSGGIAMGYNVSDGSETFPGLRYTGRQVTDPLDTMPIAEVTLAEGSAPNASNRYGDYSSMTVDPVDDCTFWFTGQYNTTSRWSTRIGSFRFDDCGEPTFVLSGSPRELLACVAEGDQLLPDVALDVASVNGFSGTVALAFDPSLPDGFFKTISPDTVDAPGESAAVIKALSGAKPGDYRLMVAATAVDIEPQSLALNASVADSEPAAVELEAPGDGASGVALQPVFKWSDAEQAVSYALEVATNPDFANLIVDRVVTATAFQPSFALDAQTEYFWRLVPANQCGIGAAVTASFTTATAPGDCPLDAVVIRHFADDLESGTGNWRHTAADPPDTWALQTDDNNSPVSAWRAESVTEISDQRLISPTVSLPAGVTLPTLQFFARRDLEAGASACFDGALLEYSDDDGRTWMIVDGGRLLIDPYTGPVDISFGSLLAGLDAWCGRQDWTRTVVDLRGLEGRELQFRFRLGTDQGVAWGDWFVDDVVVQSCEPDLVFADGFEQ